MEKEKKHDLKEAKEKKFRSRDVYNDGGTPIAREYEIPEGGGYIREEMKERHKEYR